MGALQRTRRDIGALGLGGLAAAFAGAPALAAAPGGLNEIAKGKGLRFGSAIAAFQLNDPGYLDIVRRECGVLVSENEHKWYSLHRRPDGYDFGPADRLSAWAQREGVAYRGHTLVWNKPDTIPAWVAGLDYGAEPRRTAERLVTEHIATVCARYPDIRSWDVVNETIHEGTGEFRDTIHTRTIGPEVIDVAFHAARAARPDCQLVYNDFMSWDPGGARHRDGVLRHLELWLKRGVPIDALGVQAHISIDAEAGAQARYFGARETIWRRFLDEVTGMGLDLLVTELDIADRNLPPDPAVRDAACAACVKGYLDLMLSYRQTKDVLTWGLVDRYSWLNGRNRRGAERRPLPFDNEYRAKPMRQAIAAAFAAAPAR